MTQPRQNAQGTLLLVDDEQQILYSLKRLFRKKYQVYTAKSAAEGFEILRREPIQVIISDQRMPGMTGTEFFRKAKTEHPDAIRVILTAYTDVEALISAINDGNIFRYIQKPWEPLTLENIVQEAFRYYRLINGNRRLMKELQEANAALKQEVVERTRIEEELRQHRTHLEEIVAARTSELTRVNAELQDAKEYADSANRAKSQFLATMSHELRTPLNGILGYTQILQRDQQLTSQQRRGIDIIHRSGEHLLTVINDILDMSKIEAGKLELRAQAFPLMHILENIVSMIQIRAHQKGLCFKYEPGLGLPPMLIGDEKYLRQILLNLLGNAIKFTEQGNVILRVRRIGGNEIAPNSLQPSLVTLQFSVEDTGIGIPEDVRQNIFQPFQQVKNTHFREGTGLGLAISERLARQMGSCLKLESVEGQGSRFWCDITFELDSSVPFYQGQAVGSHHVIGFTGPRRLILVVDDHAENRDVIPHMLQPLGFECIKAEHGEDALQKARERHPDLVFMDLVMPVMDGFDALYHFRSDPQFTSLPIVAVSANAFTSTRQKCLDAGFQDFLVKPFSFERILETLERILALEWIYHEEYSVQPTEMDEINEASMTIPPQELLQDLLKAATIGDIMAIRNWIEQQEELSPVYAPFVKRIRRYTQNFQLKQLLELVQAHVDQ